MLIRQSFIGAQDEFIGALLTEVSPDDNIQQFVLGYIDSNDDSFGVPVNAGYGDYLEEF